jgi:UDP:flavonoid glycosyltransferase YjiC (YdhE family)
MRISVECPVVVDVTSTTLPTRSRVEHFIEVCVAKLRIKSGERYHMSRKRILCAAASGLGHAIPALRLTLELQAAGHQALAIDGGQMVDLFERHGIETTRIPQIPFEEQVRKVRSLLETYQPDVTICDWNEQLWYALCSWRPKCRVSILRCEGFLGYERRNPFLVDKFGYDSDLETSMMNRRLRQLGVDPVADSRELYAGEVMVLPSIPQIDPLPDRVGESYPSADFVYTGPLLFRDGPPCSEFLKEWLSARRQEGVPIVLVTLGTVWGKRVYKMLADSLERTEYAVVMVVPNDERFSLERRNGTRLQVTGFVNLLDLAERVDIIMHHCGHATLHTALIAGKASITLPSGEYDREDNALRLEDLSCGKHLGHDFFRNGFNSHAIGTTIRNVLNDIEIQRGVADMSRVVREYVTTRGPGELLRSLTRLGVV